MHAALFVWTAYVLAQELAPWRGGLRYQPLNLPADFHPTAINDKGDLAGSSPDGPYLLDSSGVGHAIPVKGSVAALNNSQQVLINSEEGIVLWQPGTEPLVLAPGAASGMNRNLQIVGLVDQTPGLWSGETGWQPIQYHEPIAGVLSRRPTTVFAVNDSGQVAGFVSLYFGMDRTFLFMPGGLFHLIGYGARYVARMGLSNNLVLTTSVSAISGTTSRIHDTAGRLVQQTARPLDAVSPDGNFFLGRRLSEYYVATPCDTSISPTDVEAPSSGVAVRVRVSAEPDCFWGGFQPGSGEVEVRVEPSAGPRVFREMAGGREIRIRQGGGTCEYYVPGHWAIVPAGGGGLRVNVYASKDCAWTVRASTEWLRVKPPAEGAGDGVVEITVEANPGAGYRLGSVIAAGFAIGVHQHEKEPSR